MKIFIIIFLLISAVFCNEFFVKTTGEVKAFETDIKQNPTKLAIYVKDPYAYYIIEDRACKLFYHIGEKTTIWGKVKTRLILDTIKIQVDTVEIWNKKKIRFYFDTIRTIDTLRREILTVKSFTLRKD